MFFFFMVGPQVKVGLEFTLEKEEIRFQILIRSSIYVLTIQQKFTTLYTEKKNHPAFLTLNKKELQGEAVGLCIYS